MYPVPNNCKVGVISKLGFHPRHGCATDALFDFMDILKDKDKVKIATLNILKLTRTFDTMIVVYPFFIYLGLHCLLSFGLVLPASYDVGVPKDSVF